MKKKMRIEGMSCDHCVNHIKNALEEIDGVTEIFVDLDSKTATFNATDDVKDYDLKRAVEEAGYDVVNIEIII
jgi:copper chaperone